MFYSKSTGGFYLREIHGDAIPDDAVEITAERHSELLDGQASGKLIVADEKGRPALIDPPQPAPPTFEQVQAMRLAAYRAESDFIKIEAEYDAVSSNGTPDYMAWLSKVKEIKERYPLPEQ